MTRYIATTVTVIRTTERAAFVSQDNKEAWIPRSCFGPDEVDEVWSAASGEEVDCDIAQWKLDELGWV